jgi:septum formation inhibitor-activating ATPase MinD
MLTWTDPLKKCLTKIIRITSGKSSLDKISLINNLGHQLARLCHTFTLIDLDLGE